MKLYSMLLLAVFLSPLTAAPADGPVEIDPDLVEKCCVPPSFVSPPPTLGCPSGTHCGTPSCSGTTAAYMSGLNCISGEGHCDQEQSILIATNVPVYQCQVRYLGNNICIQMYPKWTCVWVDSGGTATAAYAGNFCGQAGDDMCS